MSIEPGVTLGPYEVLAPLGAGGMGEVWRARDPRVDRLVALKVLPEEFFESEERRARFEREAKLLASVNHPGIATLYSFEEIPSSSSSPPRHVLAMELLEGESLRGRLRAGPLPLRKALGIAVQMAKALAAAHEKGIVHRDLKPENVFLTKDDRVKLLDFGLAKVSRREEVAEAETASLSEAGAVLGTAGYMSPEQVRGEPVDHRSDIFSFGTIVYEMLSGGNPFRRETPAETMTAILKDDPPELRAGAGAADPRIEQILRHCVEKQSGGRFQSIHDLAFALERESTAGENRSGRTPPLRHRWPLALLAFGLVVGSAAFIAWRSAGVLPEASFERLTFMRGFIPSARFSPDGRTIVYGAAWDGRPVQVFSTRSGALESRPLGVPEGDILCISRRDEMGLLLRLSAAHPLARTGILARAPLAGGAPREVVEDVRFADWSPDGDLLAVARATGGKNRLEYPVGTLLLETSHVIACPRVSPDGRRVAFVDQPTYSGVQGKVAVAEKGGTTRFLTGDLRNVFGLAWSPDGKEIWMTAAIGSGGRSLYAVTMSGRLRLVAAAPGDLMLHDIASDGRVLLAQETARHGVLASAVGDRTERDLSWLDASAGTDLSPDGSTLVGQEVSAGPGSPSTVYLRRLDGTLAVRLGEGLAGKLSPDLKWVVAVKPPDLSSLTLLPTGPGLPREIPRGGIQRYLSVNWMPDGARVVFSGMEAGHGPRLYIQSIDKEDAKAITPEGFITAGNPVSPDGTSLIVLGPAGTGFVASPGGAAPRPFSGLEAGEIPIQWSADGHRLFVGGIVTGNRPLKGYVVDFPTGRRTRWREFAPADPAGILGTGPILTTPDGTVSVTSYHRFLSELYVVNGLR